MPATFYFIDGTDSIGKSTICSNLLKSFMSKGLLTRLEYLPSGEYPLGFIREKVKSKTFQTDGFSRQLLHCCSHIHSYESSAQSAYECYVTHGMRLNVIYDRGPLSTMVYGDLLISNPEYMDLLTKINTEILKYLLDQEGLLDKIYFINLDRKVPYRSEDDSYYEQVTKFEAIRLKYLDMIPVLKEEFNGRSDVRFINIDLSRDLSSDASPEEVSSYIESKIFEV